MAEVITVNKSLDKRAKDETEEIKPTVCPHRHIEPELANPGELCRLLNADTSRRIFDGIHHTHERVEAVCNNPDPESGYPACPIYSQFYHERQAEAVEAAIRARVSRMDMEGVVADLIKRTFGNKKRRIPIIGK